MTVSGLSAWRCIIGGMSRYSIQGPLTYELAQKDSPIRRFFDDRLAPGLKDVQAAYRRAAGPLLVPGVPREAADAGTIGTAADWMMRFLAHPNPSLRLAAQGASLCEMLPALKELAFMLGFQDGGAEEFTGPAQRAGAEPELLYRACWGLALLTEVYRRGPGIAAVGPLSRIPDASANSLLEAAPQAGLGQLAALRDVMESALLPAIASRQGLWATGPVFAGSQIMPGDADLVAAPAGRAEDDSQEALAGGDRSVADPRIRVDGLCRRFRHHRRRTVLRPVRLPGTVEHPHAPATASRKTTDNRSAAYRVPGAPGGMPEYGLAVTVAGLTSPGITRH